MGTTSNFFIRSKAYSDFSVFDFRILNQEFHCRNNFCNSRLVISTQKCSTVCSDDSLSFVLQQVFKIAWRKYNVLFFVQDNIPAIIIFYNLRFDIGACKIRSRIKMRNKPDCWHVIIHIAWQGSHNIGIFVNRNIFHSDCL